MRPRRITLTTIDPSDAELMAEGKHLSSELRIGAAADEEKISEEADE